MANKQILEDILQREVSRKEFLKYLGVALLGIVGVTGMLQNLRSSFMTSTSEQHKSSGYGKSPYGR